MIEFKIFQITFNGQGPVYLSELLRPYTPKRALRSASSFMLRVSRTRLKGYGDKAFEKAASEL